MNHFLTQLPVIITQFSVALIKALTDQLKWLGSIYYHIETALLGTVADIILTIQAFRYLFLLVAIGGALGYFGLWWFLAGYILIILIAVMSFFQSARQPPDPDIEKEHQEQRDKTIKFGRIPLRVLAMLVSLYFSSQFIDWKSMIPSSFETLAEEKQLPTSSDSIDDKSQQEETEKTTSTVTKPKNTQAGGTLTTAPEEKTSGDTTHCTKQIATVNFLPSTDTFSNKPLLAKIPAGEYLVTIAGTRQQGYLNANNEYYYRTMDANGFMTDVNPAAIWTTEDIKQNPAQFPLKAYGGVILHLDKTVKFIGDKHWFTTKAPIEIRMDVNDFQHPQNYEGKGSLEVVLMQCLKK